MDTMITELDELVRMRAVTKTQRLRQQINEELATLAHGDSRTDESRAPLTTPHDGHVLGHSSWNWNVGCAYEEQGRKHDAREPSPPA